MNQKACITIFCCTIVLLEVQALVSLNSLPKVTLTDPWNPENLTNLFINGNTGLPTYWNDYAIFMGNRMDVSVPLIDKSLKPDMVVGCLSTENEFMLRQNIRETWAKSNIGKDILVWFIVGAPSSLDIIREARKYNDILILSVTEIYKAGISSLPIKVYGFTQIAQKYFPETKYFMKTDDDVYVLMDRVFEEIEKSYNPISNNVLYSSVIFRTKSLIREFHNKNFVSVKQYSNVTIEAHPAGLGYIFTNELLSCINSIVQSNSINYNPNEDMFTGLLTRYCTPVQFVDMNSYIFASKDIHSEVNVAFVHPFKKRGAMSKIYKLNCPYMKHCNNLKHTLAYSQFFSESNLMDYHNKDIFESSNSLNSKPILSPMNYCILFLECLLMGFVIFIKCKKRRK